MPACLTHREFAHRVLETLPDPAAPNAAAFDWGAQGPDFLFCHRYLPWMRGKCLREYAARLHAADPVVTLGAFRDALRRQEDPATRSYVWGLLCHYALDSIAHPYINAKAAQLVAERPEQTQTTMHGEVEGALDAIILRRETGQLPSEAPLGACFPKNEPVQRRIARLYREVLSQAFGEEVSQDQLFQATQDAHQVFSLLTDRSGLKLRLFETIEKGRAHVISSHIVPITERDDVDYANLQREPWSWEGVSGDEDFFQLFDRAKGLARELILRLDGLTDQELAELTGRRPFG